MLGHLPRQKPDPRVVVSYESSDDAAAIRLDDPSDSRTGGRLLLQTVDFFTPVVDDPYQFGQIAAANSLSDIYAMGGRPLMALNVVAFPRDELPLAVLEEILKGGMAKAQEAGIPILGGHTIDDPEPKYGLVVTGEVQEDQLIRNNTAQPGDILILTKPLGTGIIATAIKQAQADDQVVAQAGRSMATLNRAAAEAALEVGVNAMTDVSGYGLLGHLLEMCTASGVKAHMVMESLPILPGTRELAEKGFIPGGTRRNLKHVEQQLTIDGPLTEVDTLLAADAQTSGGLLMAVNRKKADRLMAALKERGVTEAAFVGALASGGPSSITLTFKAK